MTMLRPLLAAAAIALLLGGCSTKFGPRGSSDTLTPAPERAVGPDCRQHCEHEYRVCMDSAAPQRGSEETQNRLFGPAFDCQERLNQCFKRCTPTQ